MPYATPILPGVGLGPRKTFNNTVQTPDWMKTPEYKAWNQQEADRRHAAQVAANPDWDQRIAAIQNQTFGKGGATSPGWSDFSPLNPINFTPGVYPGAPSGGPIKMPGAAGSNMGYPSLAPGATNSLSNMMPLGQQQSAPQLPSTTATQAPQTSATGTPPALDSFTQWFQQLQGGNGWLSGYPSMNQNPFSI